MRRRGFHDSLSNFLFFVQFCGGTVEHLFAYPLHGPRFACRVFATLGESPRLFVMAPGDIPIYYESSWSILSTIGLVNLLFGFLVIGITGYSPIALVPITVSTATAIANGLCYYALYQSHNTSAVLVGSVFAEAFWLVRLPGLQQNRHKQHR